MAFGRDVPMGYLGRRQPVRLIIAAAGAIGRNDGFGVPVGLKCERAITRLCGSAEPEHPGA
jgi:hypothetical protein